MVYTDLQYFGTLSYYTKFVHVTTLQFDIEAPFQKMSFNNRMVIGTAQGPLHLSIPIVGGRDQKTPLKEIQIAYSHPWREQHYKSLLVNYKKSPYFEYYLDSLHLLYTNRPRFLFEFLQLAQEWTKQQLRGDWEIQMGTTFSSNLSAASIKIIDPYKPNNFQDWSNKIQYQQVFQDRVGFISNLSILDLLFCVGGKLGMQMLKENSS